AVSSSRTRTCTHSFRLLFLSSTSPAMRLPVPARKAAPATGGTAASEAAVDGVVSSTYDSCAARSVPIVMDPQDRGASTTPGQVATAAAATTTMI
ncbi:unnamed protein product, partial [Urochloa humidicola]